MVSGNGAQRCTTPADVAVRCVVLWLMFRSNVEAARMDIETWELLSYIVTTIGLPAAIGVFLYEQ